MKENQIEDSGQLWLQHGETFEKILKYYSPSQQFIQTGARIRRQCNTGHGHPSRGQGFKQLGSNSQVIPCLLDFLKG